MRRLMLILVLFVVPALARAGDGDNLTRAKRFLDDMQYQKARRLAAGVLTSAGSGPEELVAAYRIHGLSLSAMGKTAAALADFRKLLAIKPDFRLSDDVSPKLAAPFYQAVAINKNLAPLSLRHKAPAAREVLSGLSLPVEFVNPLGMIRSIRLHYRTDLSAKQKELVFPVKKSGATQPQLPGKLKARRVSYYFEALNRSGGVLARAGSQKKPFEVRVAIVSAPRKMAMNVEPQPKPQPGPLPSPLSEPQPKPDSGNDFTPWYQSWWFWTAVGVVAAGATTGAVLGGGSSGSGDGPVDYGIRFK
ncbi:MAG TPA: hypothetical protein VM425_03135 [Myxococcota bacterium]|nr:hypothetical protein [Myxococcota bacterium]